MKSRDLTNGTFLIVIGALLLANSLGYMPRIPWGALLMWWPALVVIAGLQLLFPRGILSLLAPLVLILILILALQGTHPGSMGRLESVSINLGDRAHDQLVIGDIPIAQIDVTAKPAATTYALSGRVRGVALTTIDKPGTDTREIHLRPKSRRSFSDGISTIFFPPIDLALNPDSLWGFNLNVPVVRGTIDLSNLHWEQALIDSGVAIYTITATPSPETNQLLRITNGLGRVVLRLPNQANVRIETDQPAFLNNLERRGFHRSNSVYYAPNFDPDQPFLDIRLDGGITLVQLEDVL